MSGQKQYAELALTFDACEIDESTTDYHHTLQRLVLLDDYCAGSELMCRTAVDEGLNEPLLDAIEHSEVLQLVEFARFRLSLPR
jgi:hypothetical protein